MDVRELAHSVALYGMTKTKRLLAPVVSNVMHRTNTNNVKYVR